jgi:hypothetical protein
LEIGSHELFPQSGLKPQSSQVARITDLSHWCLPMQFLVEMGSHGLEPWSSKVAKITGRSHCAQLRFLSFLFPVVSQWLQLWGTDMHNSVCFIWADPRVRKITYAGGQRQGCF